MDIIESVRKLDVQPHTILVLRVSPASQDYEVIPIVNRLREWLEGNDLENVQIFLVCGKDFNLDAVSNSDMNRYGWFRKDDL